MNTDLYQHRGPLAIITLDNPPVNSLGHALRQRLVTALAAAQADTRVCAIVLTGNAKVFCAGADVSEFGTPRQTAEPVLATVLGRVENCTKPVVAAIAGVALGGGLELALACHARVALESAKLGLPEILLGLIPGSGGTQRLPRLVGLDTALALMMGGQAQTARQLIDSGLLDAVVSADLMEAACARAISLADELAVHRTALPRARDRQLDANTTQARLASERAKLTPRQQLQPAYAALLDALQAATLPLDQGLQRERELFLQLQAGTPSKALRHQFFAEREATKLPAKLQAEPRPVQTVAIIGAGTMGAGIAICALDAGLNVILLEQDAAALQRGQQRVTGHYQGRIAAGKMKAAMAASAEARLSPTTDWEQQSRADLVIEAVFEDLAVKQAVFKKIDAHARPGAVLATNTSYLGCGCDYERHPPSARRAGPAFFQPGQRHEVARSGARRPKCGRCAGHRHGAGQDLEKAAGALRQCLWLYWQPHLQRLPQAVRVHARRRRLAGRRRRCPASLWFCHGPVCRGRPVRAGHCLAHAQGAGRHA
jgi:3-hydroxyacyl-CoA dehydrogenase